MKEILAVFGTRPEAIKLWPVIDWFEDRDDFTLSVLCTGQHDELVGDLLDSLGIEPDANLQAMSENQGLAEITAIMVKGVARYMEGSLFDCVVVQGDTTSAFAGALAAFYAEVPVAHVEAGLRSGDAHRPFPEEMLRTMVDDISDFLFAPTRRARENLERSGREAGVWVTGNTVIDAVNKTLSNDLLEPPKTVLRCEDRYDRWVLATLHRRETFGADAVTILREIQEFMVKQPDSGMLFPVHPNPQIRRSVIDILGPIENIHLSKPLGYFNFLAALSQSHAVLTDSGGIQEEAAVFGKRVYVLRNVTERLEAVEAGYAELVGISPAAVRSALERAVHDDVCLRRSSGNTPFGDGRAAERIGSILAAQLLGQDTAIGEWEGYAGT